MSSRRSPGFDRLRPRTPSAPRPGVPDSEGKRALFSAEEAAPPFGSVTIACSSCGEHSVVGLGQAVRLALPSVHLPFLRPAPWSWMRCPACGGMHWVDVTVHL
jgi:hypothetical protein